MNDFLRRLRPYQLLLLSCVGLPIVFFLSGLLAQDLWNNGILVALSGKQIGLHNAIDLLVILIVTVMIINGLKEAK